MVESGVKWKHLLTTLHVRGSIWESESFGGMRERRRLTIVINSRVLTA
jgi:hypothetical protein